MTGEHPSKEILQRHHDGELSGPETADLLQHLPSCASCTAELSALGRMSDLIRDSSAESVLAANVDFDRMFAQVERAIGSSVEPSAQGVVVPLERKPQSSRWLQQLGPAVAGFALAAAVLLMFNRKEPAAEQAGPEVAMHFAQAHTVVTGFKPGRNSGQVFQIPLDDGETATVAWLDDDYEEEE